MVAAFTWKIWIGARIFQALWKCHRQFTGRVHLSEQNAGQGLAYRLTNEELLHNSAHMIQPGIHDNSIAITQYHYYTLLYP